MKQVIRGTTGGMDLAGKTINDNFAGLLSRVQALSIANPILGSGWTRVAEDQYSWDKVNWTEGSYPALDIPNFTVGATYQVSGNITVATVGGGNARVRWGTSVNNLTLDSTGVFDHTDVMGDNPEGILKFIINSSSLVTAFHMVDLRIVEVPPV